MESSIKTIHLTGSPRERGRRLGAQMAIPIQKYWREILLDVGVRAERPMTEAELREWLADRATFAAAIAPDLDEELRGIAEGADVDYEVAFAVNAGEEIDELASALGSSTYSLPAKHCLSIIVPPERSATGGLLMAQTWEAPDWTPAPWLVTVEEDAGTSVFMTDPGWIGGCGVNDRGIASVHTAVFLCEAPVGLGYSFIARRIMQAATTEAAAAAVVEYPAAGGCHYIVGDDAGGVDAVVAGELRDIFAFEGWLSTCGHYEHPRFVAKQRETKKPDSLFRTGRILELAQAVDGLIEPLQLFSLLSDHKESEGGAAVCLHGQVRVLGTLVADARSRTVWANAGNPCEGNPVTEVRLGADGPETTELH
jgi:isopenicillin-N N-acyltransferase-like protein